MNTINVSINFKERKCDVEGVILTEGDYNSTKMVFDYDVEEGIKVLEMKNRLDEIVYFDEIIDNEVVLVGKAQVIKIESDIKYYKYTDANEAVFWYDKENNKLYNNEMVEVVDFNLDDYDPVLVDASLFTIDGEYTFEVSLYENDSKLTSAYGTIDVAPEQVIITDEEMEIIYPICEDMLNKLAEMETSVSEMEQDISNLETSKQDTLISGENIKTINGESVLGSGNIDIDQDFVKDANYVHTDNNYTDSEKTKLAGLENYDDTEIKQDITDLQNNKADRSEIPDVSEFITKDVNDLTNYTTTSDMNTAISNAVGTETTNRQNSDIALQGQIDAITSASDVVDVVGTYTDLQNYDTSKLTDKDVIKVMQDSTHSNAISYYRWNTSTFDYIGSEGPFYTKGETDTLLNGKVSPTDYATTSKGGVFKSSSTYGVSMSNTGLLRGMTKSYADYQSADGYLIMSKGTLENVITGKELTNKTYVDGQNALQDTEIQALQEENNYLNSIIDQLPKVSGEGEYVTLNNTIEGKLGIELKSSELEQFTTTGKNIFRGIETLGSGSTYINGVLTIASSTYNKSYEIAVSSSTEYALSYVTTASGNRVYIREFDSNGESVTIQTKYGDATFTTSATTTKIIVDFSPSSSSTFPITISKIMIRLSSTTSDYEPYTNGASPNPDFPQQIHTISGDNQVVVYGRNIAYTGWVDNFITRINSSPIASKETYDNRNCLKYNANAGYQDYDNKYLFKTNWKENTAYTLVCDINSGSTFGNIAIEYTDGTIERPSSMTTNTWTSIKITTNASKTIKYVRPQYGAGYSYIDLDTFMIYEGTENISYEPYQQQVYPIILPVKNLFDKSTMVQDGYISSSNKITTGGSAITKTIAIPCQENKTYTISKVASERFRVGYITTSYGSNVSVSGTITDHTGTKITITTGVDAKYLVAYIYDGSADTISLENILSSIQVEEGSKVNSYWAYGTTPIELCEIGNYKDEFYLATESDTGLQSGKWYLKKNIGKVVLDGSEDWNKDSSSTNDYEYFYFRQEYIPTMILNSNNMKVDKFSRIVLSSLAEGYFTTSGVFGLKVTKQRIGIIDDDNKATRVSKFKTWLSTHNTIVYYQSDTPEYILLNDTLQNQINDIYYTMKSYKEQTNISQVNNDLEFNMNASALLDLNSLINS